LAGVAATVTSTAGDAALTVADPATLTLHDYSGPASNDPLTIRFKQTIGASEPLRTGAYTKTLTFTHAICEPVDWVVTSYADP
jgi:hypothetical protein